MAKRQYPIAPYVPLPGNAPTRQAQMLPTEGAVIYGQSQAAANLPGQLNYMRQQRWADETAQQQEAQRVAQQWRENELEVFDGSVWGNQIAEIEKAHMDEGLKLREEGINPYESDDPRAQKFRSDRRNIVAQRAYAKNAGSQYLKALEEVRKNPNRYDPRSIEAINEFISSGNLGDYYASNAQLPMLSARFDPIAAIKDIRAQTIGREEVKDGWKTKTKEVDLVGTENAILSRLLNTPGGAEYVAEITGGLPISDVRSLPSTIEGNIEKIRNDYDGDPELRAQLADMGIGSKDSPLFDQAVEQMAREAVAIKNNYDQVMGGFIAQASSGLDLSSSRVRDTTEEDLAIRRQNAALAKQREDRLRSEASDTPGVNYESSIKVPIGSSSQNTSGTTTARNAITLHNSSVNITGGGAYNMRTRSAQKDMPSISGQIVNLGEYPFDPAGNLLDDTQIANNANVEYRKMAHIREGSGSLVTDLLVPADRIPVNSLSKDKRGIVSQFLSSSSTESPSGQPARPTINW